MPDYRRHRNSFECFRHTASAVADAYDVVVFRPHRLTMMRQVKYQCARVLIDQRTRKSAQVHRTPENPVQQNKRVRSSLRAYDVKVQSRHRYQIGMFGTVL